MDKPLAQSVLLECNLTEPILDIRPLTGGRQHDTWLIQTDSNRFVLKCVSLKTYIGREEVDRFEHCEALARSCERQLGVSVTAIPSSRQRRYVTHADDKHFILYPYIDGEPKARVDTDAAYVIGGVLFSLHQAHFEDDYFALEPIKPFKTDLWERLVPNYMTQDALASLTQLADQCYQARLDYKGERLLSHRDINTENVLWQDDRTPKLIDWESAGLIAPEVELLGLAFNFAGIGHAQCDFECLKAVFKGYSDSGGRSMVITMANYRQAYASWFAWLEHCLTSMAFDEHERQSQLRLSLAAIDIMNQYQSAVIDLF